MSALQDALTEYLATRRALGTELKWPESSLRKFVEFVEAHGAEFVTTELAMRWTLQSVGVQPTGSGTIKPVEIHGGTGTLRTPCRRTSQPTSGAVAINLRRSPSIALSASEPATATRTLVSSGRA